MSAEPIVFPDIEGILVDHLNGLLDLKASTRIPNPRPSRFVRVVRTGGPRQGLVTDQAQVTIESWDTDSVEAYKTAQTVRAHVGALGGRRLDGHQVHRVQEMSGPGNLPDPTSGHARYTWSVLIDLRGQPLT